VSHLKTKGHHGDTNCWWGKGRGELPLGEMILCMSVRAVLLKKTRGRQKGIGKIQIARGHGQT
jgi:hypothetical protein